jgi:hypothetical protein
MPPSLMCQPLGASVLERTTKQMTTTKTYKILSGLPAYGPMYVSVTDNDEPFYSEGFVLEIFKSNGTSWIANFRPGWTSFSKVFEFPEHHSLVVFAGGIAYIMNPDNEKPKFTFGITISEVLQTDNGSLICSDDIHIMLLDNSTGELWKSERISFDGIKNLTETNGILTGLSFDPTYSDEEKWIEFSINLRTKEIKGGSYREFLERNPNMVVQIKDRIKENKKPWWKIW